MVSRAISLAALRVRALAGGNLRARRGGATSSSSVPLCRRALSSSASSSSEGEREAMEYDVVLVGAGPAGLAASIRLKQLNADLSVCVVEKGAEVGAHILSGNVFEPRALDELIPDWKDRGAPVGSPVADDNFAFLTESGSYGIPGFLLPKQLHNDGNYVISLSELTRWLGLQAEELGVEIYPGFAAAEVLYGADGAVCGIATRDVGLAKDGTPKPTFERGMELRGRQTLFAEGARGSCSEQIISKFGLREGRNVQTYGLGLKEVWQVPPEKCQPGQVLHTLGWPLQKGPMDKTYGGGFLYHMAPDQILLGLVVGLNYANPYLNPYLEFQRWKHHPSIAKHLEGGECISYGARCLNEGGWHSIPRLAFPGGALLGCAAGFLNSVKIKGTHGAIKSGSLAAESVHALFERGGDNNNVLDFEERVQKSWLASELKEVRNCSAAFHHGLLPGMLYTGLSAHVLKGREPWTLKSETTDAQATGLAAEHQPIDYPKPDGKLSFDLLSNLQRSGTNHEHDQPSHLRIKAGMDSTPKDVSFSKHAGPEQRFCPAQVYEYTENEEAGGKKLVINAQNCLHCKCCSIKTPEEYIDWTVPEGGGGPAYTVM